MIEPMKDYYRILDIPLNANQKDVEKAYQKIKNLVSKNSVSLYSILPSVEKDRFMSEVEEAYNVLINPEKRNIYDVSIKGIAAQKENERESEFAKQLSFGFAKEAFTYLDYTRKAEKIHKDMVDRIRNDYLIRPGGISIRILETQDPERPDTENVQVEPAPKPEENHQSVTSPAPSGQTNNQNNEIPATAEEEKQSESEVVQAIRKNPQTGEQPGEEKPEITVTANSKPVISETQDTEQTKKENLSSDIQMPDKEKIVIDENSEFSGPFLRKIRESMGITVKDIAKTTKISTANITYLEEEDYRNLPALVYIKGYLAQIAKCLNLRSDIVVRSYLSRMNERQEKKGK